MNKKLLIKKSIILIVIICVLLLLYSLIVKLSGERENMKEEIKITGDFNTDIIKKVNSINNDTNYLISPYNIELALNMLREGALGNTKNELDNFLGNRKINDISVKDKIGIANAVFIKNTYQNDVKKDYYNTLKTKYNSDIIYDEFANPNKINNWVKEKTYGMIDKVLDNVNKDFVMGLASALAIDVKWLSSFECTNTISEEFTKLNNKKINAEMMHKTLQTENYKYISNDDVQGVTIPYKTEDNSNVQLEFVGLLPKKDVNTFINSLTKEKLNTIDKDARKAGDKFHINVSLPRFKYDYNVEDFIDVLKDLGIHDTFDEINADFKKMIDIKENVYVGEAVHKTHIELNEEGTKAAAVTYFGMFKATGMLPQEVETVDIKFDKPFVYLIRETNTKEILFFGVVYEPNIWNGSTCNNK